MFSWKEQVQNDQTRSFKTYKIAKKVCGITGQNVAEITFPHRTAQ